MENPNIMGILALFHLMYPLVNVHKTMENHHVSWENSRHFAIFNSDM
jgi:hypothetical protein